MFPHSSVGKESACSAGDPGSIPGSGRSPGERNGNPLQYSSLENPMDRGAWQATAHGDARAGRDLAIKLPPGTEPRPLAVRAWQPTPVFLPRESHRQKSLAGYSPLHHTESDMTAVIQHALMQRRSVPGNADKGKTQTVVKGLGFQAWS